MHARQNALPLQPETIAAPTFGQGQVPSINQVGAFPAPAARGPELTGPGQFQGAPLQPQVAQPMQQNLQQPNFI